MNSIRAKRFRRYWQCMTMSAMVIALSSMPVFSAMGDKDSDSQSEMDSRDASCILRASWNTQFVPLDGEMMNTLLNTSQVRAAAIREVFHRGGSILMTSEEISTEIMTLSEPNLLEGNAPYLMRLDVHVNEIGQEGEDIEPRAEQLLHALVKRLRVAIVQLSEENAANIVERKQSAEARVQRAKERVDRLIELRRAMSEQAGRADLSRDSVVDELRWLEEQVREHEIERVSLAARRSALEVQIARLSKASVERIESDSILTELQKVHVAQSENANRVAALFESGTVSVAELGHAQEKVQEIKIRIAERKEELTQRMGGDELDALNHQLTELSIQSAEIEARVAYAKARLEELRPLLHIADRLENDVLLSLPSEQEALKYEIERLGTLTDALSMHQPPKLTVVGSDESAK